MGSLKLAVAVAVAIGSSAIAHAEPGNFKAALALSADGAAYDSADLHRSYLILTAKDVPPDTADQVIKLFVSRHVAPDDIDLFSRVALLMADATGDDVLFEADELSYAFSGGVDGVKALDKKINFLSSYDYKRMLSLEDSGQFGAALAVAKDSFRSKLAASNN